MNKLLALGAAALALALGAPAVAQPMEHHETTRVVTPGGATVTRTVDRDDGSRTVVRRHVDRDDGRVVRRTVVRRTVVRHVNTGWHRHHRHCATRWHHGQRVTRCWTR